MLKAQVDAASEVYKNDMFRYNMGNAEATEAVDRGVAAAADADDSVITGF